MNTIYSVILLLISGGMYGYWYITPDFEATSKFWIQLYASLGGGIGLFCYEHLSKLSKLKSLLPKIDMTPTVPKVEEKTPDQIFEPQAFEEHDFACLVHLRNRVQKAGSKDGIATVEKLASIIFSLGKKE